METKEREILKIVLYDDVRKSQYDFVRVYRKLALFPIFNGSETREYNELFC